MPGHRVAAGRLRLPLLTTAATLTVTALTVAGCARTTATAPAGGHPATPVGSTATGRPGGVGARLGALTISDARIPLPASPDVAAAYATVRNTGRTADRLVTVATPVAGMAMLHRYQRTSNGAEVMVPVAAGASIPPGGTLVLQPGGMHLMLQPLRRALRVGDHVPLTLRFAHAGTLTLSVPVIPLTEDPMGPMPARSGGSDPSDMSGMDGMSGMSPSGRP
jgi:copper(I)-binding protein